MMLRTFSGCLLQYKIHGSVCCCEDRKQASAVRGIMRLPPLAETGSTSDLDSAMADAVPFDDWVLAEVLQKPSLLKLADHKHMVEYLELRRLNEATYKFG